MKSKPKLLASNDTPFNGKAFFITKNKQRRWVQNKDYLESYGFKWPDDVRWVNGDEIKKYNVASYLPFAKRKLEKGMEQMQMREYVASRLKGKGVEFGAATCPMPIPIDCEVEFADLFILDPENHPYYDDKGAEYVKAKYITSMDKMQGIKNDSLDFIIACHVIEHVRNPMQAIENAWNKLKIGGKLMLVVPHMDFTFDKKREITTLEHLILDYEHPSTDRDILHYVEYFTRSFPAKDVYKEVLKSYNNKDADLHYHTWRTESFKKMINYFSKNIKPWKVWFHDIIHHPTANEFYFVLTKKQISS